MLGFVAHQLATTKLLVAKRGLSCVGGVAGGTIGKTDKVLAPADRIVQVRFRHTERL
jgi:hypothetical protein